MLDTSKLVGTYQLKRHGIYSVEQVFVPTSSYLQGELRYGSGSFLSVLILFADPPAHPREIFGYTGTFEMESDSVVLHHLTMTTVPAMKDTTEKRHFQFNGNELILSRPFPDGRKFEAIWIKVS